MSRSGEPNSGEDSACKVRKRKADDLEVNYTAEGSPEDCQRTTYHSNVPQSQGVNLQDFSLLTNDHQSETFDPMKLSTTFGDDLFNMGWFEQDIQNFQCPSLDMDPLVNIQMLASPPPSMFGDVLLPDLDKTLALSDSPYTFSNPETPNVHQSASLTLPVSPSDNHWSALSSRHRQHDTSFLFAVTSTKIFCRPSCPSRRPIRTNVLIFDFPYAAESAKNAGFRPCKRCHPEDTHTPDQSLQGTVSALRLIIRDATNLTVSDRKAGAGITWEGDQARDPDHQGLSVEEASPSKSDLRLSPLSHNTAGLSPFHFHRVFKSRLLLTPGEMVTACRALALGDCLNTRYTEKGPDQTSSRAAILECIQAPSNAEDSQKEKAKWTPRTARKALGGVAPFVYAAGCSSTQVAGMSVEGFIVQTTALSPPNSTIPTMYSYEHIARGMSIGIAVLRQTSCTKSGNGHGVLTVLVSETQDTSTSTAAEIEQELARQLNDRFPDIAVTSISYHIPPNSSHEMEGTPGAGRVRKALDSLHLGLKSSKDSAGGFIDDALLPSDLRTWVWRCRIWIALIRS